MKRILLVCCLLAVSATVTFAQAQSTATASAQPAVSKNDFYLKMNELNTLIAGNKMDAAKAKWEELHHMMGNAIAATKYKMDAASKSNNATEKTQYIDQMKKQRGIYAETLKLREDLAANKDQIRQKLVEFSTTML